MKYAYQDESLSKSQRLNATPVELFDCVYNLANKSHSRKWSKDDNIHYIIKSSLNKFPNDRLFC